MAERNLLAIHKLDHFKKWLDKEGIEYRNTSADFQVLQVRLPGTSQWQAIYQKLGAKVHLSVPKGLISTVERYLWGRSTPVAENIKPVGEAATETLPWV